MKKSFSVLIAIIFSSQLFAQAPQKMSYQAVIRNSSNALVVSKSVGIQISILQGSATGTAVYIERHFPTTNSNGLASIEIGTGTPVKATFAGINWSAGPYFIKTDTDPAGQYDYTISGTNQLMSVPYALFSANASVGGFKHYLGEAFNGGIIYYLYKGSDGLEHGLIVALTESLLAQRLQWQSTSTLVNANRSWDGAYNTALMTNSPAATYIAGLGAGWYLPSIDELAKLYYNRFETNKALFTGGNTLLSNAAYYWSSCEIDATSAYYFDFTSGYVNPMSKTNIFQLVRAIKTF